MQRQEIDRRVFLNMNPDWLTQRLLAIRLHLGLPCIEGPVETCHLGNESVRRSVSAYYYMIMSSEMPLEPVHFGVQHTSNYKLLNLLSTQKRDDFESMFHYTYKNGDVCVDGMSIKDWCANKEVERMASLTIVHPNAAVCSVEPTSRIFVAEVEDIVVTAKIPVLERDNTIDTARVEVDEDVELFESVLFHGEHEVGTKMTLILPGIDDLYDMASIDIEGSMSQEKKFCSEDLAIGDHDCTDLEPGTVSCVVKKTPWNMVVEYHLQCHIIHRYCPSNIYAPIYDFDRRILGIRCYMHSLEVRIRDFFRILGDQLLCLPNTKLVRHNFTAVTRYRLPTKMPSARLLNQCLMMVGRHNECNDWFFLEEEKWCFYSINTDWCDTFSRVCMEKKIYHNLMDILREPVSREWGIYRADVFSDWPAYFVWDTGAVPKRYVCYQNYITYLKTGIMVENPEAVAANRAWYHKLEMLKLDPGNRLQ